HSSTLAVLRHFTKDKELVRHAVTQFATSFLSLKRLYEKKGNMRRMFTWVLRLIDGEKKPPIRYIYEAIEKKMNAS
ncbi:hypothetical protein HN51_028802, partial [Arachis hypogaea]